MRVELTVRAAVSRSLAEQSKAVVRTLDADVAALGEVAGRLPD